MRAPAVARRREEPSERGSITVVVAVCSIGLLAIAGLVVDGGAKVRAAQRADRIAAQAARAGGQAVDVTEVLAGGSLRVDRRAALTAAAAYLRAAGVEGSTQLVDGGSGLEVTTTTTAPTIFLGLIGVPSITVRGGAEVSLVPSPRGAQP